MVECTGRGPRGTRAVYLSARHGGLLERPPRSVHGWYAEDMARGWESKAVESQQADWGSVAATGPKASPQELERRHKATSTVLALADTTAQLQAACRPLHRDMLRQRKAALEDILAALSAAPGEALP